MKALFTACRPDLFHGCEELSCCYSSDSIAATRIYAVVTQMTLEFDIKN